MQNLLPKELLILQKNDIRTALYNIAEDDIPSENYDKKTLIGFCYPTHGFNAPPIVLNFISEFPKGKARVFLLNTRAGMKLFTLQTPGISGIALWLPALILFLKGHKAIGFRPLDMPSNWISLHPGLSKKAVAFIISECKLTLSKFTDKMIFKKKELSGLLWLPIDIAGFPISIMYYFYGRFALAKTFYANYNCTNCGLCIKNCPINVIKEINKRPFWTYKCESCMKCMNNCPRRAIETSHGFTFVLWWLAFSFLPLLILKLFVKIHIINYDFYKENFDLLINGSMFFSDC